MTTTKEKHHKMSQIISSTLTRPKRLNYWFQVNPIGRLLRQSRFPGRLSPDGVLILTSTQNLTSNAICFSLMLCVGSGV